MADFIFGDYDFEEKLPVAGPNVFNKLPLKNDDDDANLYDPLFPLGFGLNCESC